MAHVWSRVSEEVEAELAAGGRVVALESTLIAHGLPWPSNLEAARGAEAEVRASGSVPASIAVLGGVVRVGLDPNEIEAIARAEAGRFLKASRRDLGAALAQRRDAATTVSATLWIARSHGIALMATGGLGGVHRGAARTFDISTDLDELARADGTLVVCAGFKSILDLPATLEALETRGVPVVGYRTSDLPAFTTRTSGLPLETRVEGPEEASDLLEAHRALKLPGGVVLAQPVDASVALDPAETDAMVAEALAEAHAQGVIGKAVTPFLLDFVRTATGGKSLIANTALIRANARLAGEVAAAFGARGERRV